MNKKIKERVLEEYQYIMKKQYTIREIGNIFAVSKSTVHKDLNDRLLSISMKKYIKVKDIFNKHIDERHIKGGEATRKKYNKIRGENDERYRDRFGYS